MCYGPTPGRETSDASCVVSSTRILAARTIKSLQQRSLVRIVRRSIRSSDLVIHKVEWKVGANSDVEDMIARQSRA